MMELFSQRGEFAAAFAGLLLLAAMILLLARARRRRLRDRAVEPLIVQPVPGPPIQRIKVDPAVLLAAVSEAETAGERGRLPGLYLSLAQCRLEEGDSTQAEDLLRRCILGATPARHKATHARARLALGDLAHIGGDPTTACEHWQIARALFHELKQASDHEAAEQRMLRNGCPTDWVLTDF
jgi:tetratricopeptide (TPR) repeat protein